MPYLRGGSAGTPGFGSSGPNPFSPQVAPSKVLVPTDSNPVLSFDITETSDTVAAAVGLVQTVSAAITESSDTVAANLGLVQTISAAITETADTVSANIAAVQTVSAAITESPDVVAATVNAIVSLSAAITETSDAVAANIAAIISLSAAITETSDTVAGNIATVVSLSAAITETADTFSASVVAFGTATITADVTETPDSVSASLSVVSQQADGGGFAWKGPVGPNYWVHPEFADRPRRRKKRIYTEGPQVVIESDATTQTGIIETPSVQQASDILDRVARQAAEARAVRFAKQAAAEQARRDRLIAIALADDEWLMVA